VLKGFLRDGHSRDLLVLRAYWPGRIRRGGELSNRAGRVALIAVAVLTLAGVAASRAPSQRFPTVLVAGDIADCASEGDERTAALLDAYPGTVLALGDTVYEHGTIEEFRRCFDPSWGRHKQRIRPTPGNHDYASGGSGYFGYFGTAAGPSRRGYYSFDIGDWHVVSLNSERDTGARGAQVRWLRADLAATEASCVLAFWHRPRWSAGRYGDDARTAAFWKALYAAGADVVLAGHDHNYQRYPPLNARGEVDRARGIRSFVVGTGGRNLYSLRSDPRRRAASDDTWGLLQLTFKPGAYTWRFVPIAGGRYRDAGSGICSRR
jgi:acid phosphatase type 7